MKKIYLIFSFIFICFTYVNAQIDLKWVHSVSDSVYLLGTQIKYDSYGNVYKMGQFNGTIQIDTITLRSSSISSYVHSTFVCKYSANGNLIWAKQITGTGRAEGNALHIDKDGYVYIGGVFSNTIYLDPGTANHNVTAPSSDAVFLVKLNNSGEYVWSKYFSSNDSQDITQIDTDSNNDVFIAGNFIGVMNFDPLASNYTIAVSKYATFLYKLTNLGDFGWVKIFQRQVTSNIFGVPYLSFFDIDKAGDMYLVGIFSGTVDFDPDTAEFLLTSVPDAFFDSRDIFIVKLSSNGEFIWAKNIGGGNAIDCVEMDDFGNIYMMSRYTGQFGSYYFTNNTLEKIRLFDGSQIWNYYFSSSNLNVKSICAKNTTDIYIAGSYYGTNFDFDFGAGTYYLSTNGVSDMFIEKLDSAGNFKWVKTLGERLYNEISDMNVDKEGNIYIAGFFVGTIDFDVDSTVYSLTSSDTTTYDLFYAKYTDNDFVNGNKTNKKDESSALKIYPNPANEVIYLKSNEKGIFSITDLSGKILKSYSIDSPQQYMLGIENISSGMYLYQFTGEKEIKTGKLVIK